MDMSLELDVRRRRALYRAGHRGMKELDLLLSQFARARIADMNELELCQFEALLELPDPQLHGWLVSLEPPVSDDVPKFVGAVRAYHGL